MTFGSSYNTPRYDSRAYGDKPSYGGGSYGGGDRYGGSSRSYGGGDRRDRSRDRNTRTEYLPINKSLYEEHPNVANMSEQEVQQFRADSHIKILTEVHNCPKPIRNFEEAVLTSDLMSKFDDAGFKNPSPIQGQGWPVAMSGKDMIGIAETGSGKTLAFLVPALMHIRAQEPLRSGETGPQVLVMAPTRELVTQIEAECKKWAPRDVYCTSLVGGMPKGPQIRDLRAGCQIVIATPGRLLDLLEMRLGFNLDRCTYLCLDEADRMLDMGFERDIRKICGKIRPDRQTLLWSATWPKEVAKLARDLCACQPVHIHIGEGEIGELKANHRITQTVECDVYNKRQRLQEILQQEDAANSAGKKSIIFCKTKKGCDSLSWELRQMGYTSESIHGDKSQQERDYALQKFKRQDNSCNMLVATDVAARGLDVKSVEVVINYDFPMQVEDYVHRIGRCGRAGTYGRSYAFFNPNDVKNPKYAAHELIKILTEANQEVPSGLSAMANGAGGGGKGSFGGGYKGARKGNSKGGFGKGGGKFGGKGRY